MLLMAAKLDQLNSLDPIDVCDELGTEIVGNTYDRLVGLVVGRQKVFYGSAATGWTRSKDGKTFLFDIRRGISFSSGNALTAHDVVYSLRRLTFLGTPASGAIVRLGITRLNFNQMVSAAGDFTLVLRVREGLTEAEVLYALAQAPFSIIDQQVVERNAFEFDHGRAWLKSHHAGSGPFRLLSWMFGELIALGANETYWAHSPRTRGLAIYNVVEPRIQFELIKGGQVHFARNLATEHILQLWENRDVVIHPVEKDTIHILCTGKSEQRKVNHDGAFSPQKFASRRPTTSGMFRHANIASRASLIDSTASGAKASTPSTSQLIIGSDIPMAEESDFRELCIAAAHADRCSVVRVLNCYNSDCTLDDIPNGATAAVRWFELAAMRSCVKDVLLGSTYTQNDYQYTMLD
jgi:hypothetical protein